MNIIRGADGLRIEEVRTEPRDLDGAAMLRIRDGLADLMQKFPEAMVDRGRWTLCDDLRSRALMRQLPATMKQAACVLWDWDVWSAAAAGSEQFEGVKITEAMLVDRPVLWFWPTRTEAPPEYKKILGVEGLERGYVLFFRSLGVKTAAVEPSLEQGWVDAADMTGRMGLTIVELWMPVFEEGERLGKVEELLPVPRAFPSLYVGDAIPFGVNGWVAGLNFMRLPFVSVEKAPISRQVARQYERKHGRTPDVRMVTLRRAGREAPASAGCSEATVRDWSCQWLVQGHWRRRADRWGEGPPIYVTPHLKGPEGKPFRAPRETAYRVKR